MMARISGGVLAWVVSVAPLGVVNLIAAFGVFTPDAAALIGAVALVAGVALGALTAGLFGGRARDLIANAEETVPTPVGARGVQGAPIARLGARGALFSGGIAATLYALTMGGLLLLAAQLNALLYIVAQNPIRITAAILCVAAIYLGLTMLVGWLVARGATRDDLADLAAASGSPGAPMGASPAMRAPVAASRPHPPSGPARSAARADSARATRRLTAADYGAAGGYSAYSGYDDHPRPPQPSRPRKQRDPRYGAPAPASHARDPHDDYRDDYRRQGAADRYANKYQDAYRDGSQDYDDERADRRDSYGDDDDHDEADRRREDDRWGERGGQANTRAGVRPPARGNDR